MPFEVSLFIAGTVPERQERHGTGIRQLFEPQGRSAAEDPSKALIWSLGGREERVQMRGEISVSARVLSSCCPFQASAWTSEWPRDHGGLNVHLPVFRTSVIRRQHCARAS